MPTVEADLAPVETEERPSEDPRWLQGIVWVVALAMAAFHLWVAATRPLDYLQQRPIHLSFALALLFLLYPTKRKSKSIAWRLSDVALAAVAAFLALYPYFLAETLWERAGRATEVEQMMGLALIVLVIEGCRRVAGWEMTIVATTFLLYMFFGQWSPILPHPNFTTHQMTFLMYLSSEGIYSSPLGVSSTIIVMFMILAAFLRGSGAAQFLVDMCTALLGHVRGGAAKAGVAGSALFGTLSGSSLSNVATVGTMTIPMMKSTGFSATFAAAIESVASTGGILMPPVMGTAAFLMADFLRVPYGTICVMAIMPAVLYFACVYFYADLEAARIGLVGSKTRPRARDVLIKGWYLVLPLLVLVVLLMVLQWGPMKAAFWALVTAIALAILRNDRAFLKSGLWRALRQGAIDASVVAVICAAAGIMIGVVNITGIGVKLSGWLVSVADGNVYILIGLGALAAVVLGLGLDSASTYIILAILVAPAMSMLNVPPAAAHFFLFYFGATAGITPPVAVTAYAAAGIAGAPPGPTGWLAFRIVLPSFFIGFLLVLEPAILGFGTPMQVAWSFVTGLVGVYAVTAGTVGYVKVQATWFERALWFGGGLALVAPGVTTGVIGFALFAIGIVLHRRRALIVSPAVPRPV